MNHLKNNRRHKTLYKKFLTLKTYITNDIKITKLKKKKWKIFLTILEKQRQTKIKLKPFTNYNYTAIKFASQGNSLKKKFKNDLIAKKTFNYFYGNLMKKYLKKRMGIIYKSKKSYYYKLVCLKFFESKLDSVLYRSKFCFSMKNAQHLISHKHIKINNKIKKNKSYILKEGDVVSVSLSASVLIKFNIRKIIRENLQLIIQLKTYKKKFYRTYKKQFRRWLFKQLKIKTRTQFFNLLWPIPPKYLIINYKTLEIIFNSIQNFNFSIYFPFKLNLTSIIINYYRH